MTRELFLCLLCAHCQLMYMQGASALMCSVSSRLFGFISSYGNYPLEQLEKEESNVIQTVALTNEEMVIPGRLDGVIFMVNSQGPSPASSQHRPYYPSTPAHPWHYSSCSTTTAIKQTTDYKQLHKQLHKQHCASNCTSTPHYSHPHMTIFPEQKIL